MKGNDLGRDEIVSLVLRLALPTMLAQLVNVLYGIVDRIFISAIPDVGAQALAGVGVCGPIVTLITSFAMLVGVGGSPLMAMRMGEGNRRQAEDILANCALMLLALAALLTLCVALGGDWLLTTFGASEALMPYAGPYLRVITAGILFSIGTAGLNQFIICQGFSGVGMITVVAGALTNVALDPIMIFTLKLGCRGAALATILSQAVSFALCLGCLLSRRPPVRIRLGGYGARVMVSVLKYGFSPFVIVATDSVVIIALNSVLQRYGGAQADLLIAAATITQSYMQLITMPLLGLTGGTQPLLSFNLGACALDRIRRGIRVILKFGLLFTSAMFVASQFLPSLFARVFTDDPALIAAAVRAIRVYTLGVLPMTLQYCFVDALTALGVPHVSMSLSLARKLNMTLWTILLPALGLGAFAAFCAEPIADLCAGILSTVAFRKTFEPLLSRRSMTGGEIGR